MVTTPFARAGILKSLKKEKIVKISGKLFFHSKVEYPKLQIPWKKKLSFSANFRFTPALTFELIKLSRQIRLIRLTPCALKVCLFPRSGWTRQTNYNCYLFLLIAIEL